MNIAVVYDEGRVGVHFGHAKQMKIYKAAPTGLILNSKVVDTHAEGHVAMCAFLQDHDVNAVICGNIGKAACGLILMECQMDLYAGIAGDPDRAVRMLLDGKLEEFRIHSYSQIYERDQANGKKDCDECGEDGCDCEGDCSSCSGHGFIEV